MSETQEQQWFSTKVRLVCLIASMGAVRYMDVVYVFRGTDFQTAFKRAVELGKCQEKSYHNADGKEVVWKLVEILSLDLVQAESLDGAEVYSEPVDLAAGESYDFDTEFHPERSAPTQTI